MFLATVSFSFLKEPDSITYKGFCNTNVLFLIKMKTATCWENLFREKGIVQLFLHCFRFLLTLMKGIVSFCCKFAIVVSLIKCELRGVGLKDLFI